LAREHFHCGDESGVRGCLIQNIGQVMSAVAVAMSADLVFADYKASQGPTMSGKVRGIVCMTLGGQMRILGEFKTPWIVDHDLKKAIHTGGARFRNVVGE
jgi:hypothetical protein